MTDKNLLLQDDAFAPAVPDTMEHLPSFHCEPADRRVLQAEGRHPAPCARFCESTAYEAELRRLKSGIEIRERQLATSSKDIAELLDIVRTICCMADRMAQPGSENYPSPLSDFSPLMIAARQACVERGFTAGGLAIDITKGKSQ